MKACMSLTVLWFAKYGSLTFVVGAGKIAQMMKICVIATALEVGDAAWIVKRACRRVLLGSSMKE